MGYRTFMNNAKSLESSSSDESGSHYFEENQGFSLWTAAAFLTALMAGMGVLVLPHALAGTGWWGLAVILWVCVNSFYCAVTLGRTWTIMEKEWEEYRSKIRSPYPAIALRAVGPWMRYVLAVILQATFLGVSVVYLLLCAQIAQSVTEEFVTLPYHYWILLLAIALCPFTWFGSIEEFRFAAFGALGSAAVVCVFLLAVVLKTNYPKITTQGLSEQILHPTFSSSSLAFGTIIFSFGGVFFFPTVQNDMARREEFPKATLLGFTGLLILYMPATIAGYGILGASTPVNLLTAVQPGPLKIVIQCALALHVLLAFLLFINPIAQEIEEAIGIQPSFSWKRCCVRSVIVAVVVVIAYTIPHFDKIMNLIGGSTFTLLTFIFPPVFYVLLINKTRTQYKESKRRISLWEALFILQIILTGIAGGVACTYFAVLDIYKIFDNKESTINSVL